MVYSAVSLCFYICIGLCQHVYMYIGVWDVMSNVEVAEFIRKKIASNMKPPLVRICKAISRCIESEI